MHKFILSAIWKISIHHIVSFLCVCVYVCVFLGHRSRENPDSKRYVQANVHCSIFPNNQDMGAT